MQLRSLGEYTIIRTMMGGGVTNLYLASHARHGRVVVRCLKPALHGHKRLYRNFFSGGEILAQLHHPLIVRFIEMGTWQDMPFMVLEYVESRNLRELLGMRSPLLASHRLQILRKQAEALAYVHSEGFLHLDYKPENILIRNDASVVLIDFDLAMPRPARPLRIRSVPGTPAYLAPELLGRNQLDQRADVYAFGVAAYELFSGHKPFDGESEEELRRATLNPRLEARSLRLNDPAIHAGIDEVILKCLAKDPDRRYPEVSMIARDLERLR